VKTILWPTARLDDPKLLAQLSALAPDFLLVLSNQFVPESLRKIPTHGCVNIHLALLPCHRGREPVFQAFLHKDEKIGVTVHEMTEKLDQGRIYAKDSMALQPGMTVLGVMDDLWKKGAMLFCDVVLRSERGVLESTAQDESKASYHAFPTAVEVAAFRKAGGRFL
jgi:methionyl-tRNA formyltransferase